MDWIGWGGFKRRVWAQGLEGVEVGSSLSLLSIQGKKVAARFNFFAVLKPAANY
jgi:hypothetical protein